VSFTAETAAVRFRGSLTAFCLAHQARAFARLPKPVLLLGETGTGKEVVAKILHENGATAGGPFLAVNCATLPRELIASELFGIEEGVATGVRARRGLSPRPREGRCSSTRSATSTSTCRASCFAHCRSRKRAVRECAARVRRGCG
jgi:transcriptional regulator of acetoin/glycerol metabolism